MRPAIEVRDLRFTFPDGTDALHGVSFAVDEHECLGVIGPNGAGKSTLLLHLNGLLPETPLPRPAVSVFGVPITRETRQNAHRTVGLLFQDPDDQLFCPTVAEDVGFGPQQQGITGTALREVVGEALDKVGLKGYEQRSPHHLSGGEKQRVCLAGLLACSSRILVLDEPTANLDPRGKRGLKALLSSLPVTKVIATHDLELVVELCERVIVLDNGRCVADGPTVDLLSDEELMQAHGLERPHILRHRHPHPARRASRR
jgi:cobalt/nickel transport system ATP-binding protein